MFIYKGKTYYSFSACCRENNYNEARAYKLMSVYNKTKEEVLELFDFEKEYGEVKYGNKTYKNIGSFRSSKRFLNIFDLCDRLKEEGDDADINKIVEDLTKDTVLTNACPIDYNGVHYNSITECTKKLGIPYANFVQYKFLHPYLPIEKIVDDLINGNNRSTKEKEIIYEGKSYKSQSQLCKAYGISPMEANRQIRYYKCSIQEVIDKIRSLDEEVTYNGVTYENIPACLKALDITLTNYSRYKNRYTNITPYECIRICLGGDAITYKGTYYESLLEYCKKNHIPYIRVLDLMYDKKEPLPPNKAISKIIEENKKERNVTCNTGKVKFRGKWYKSATEMFREYGVKRGSIYFCMKKNNCNNLVEALEYYLTARKR